MSPAASSSPSFSPPAEADVAAQAQAEGLGATEVDASALLKMIRDLQGKVDAMEADKRSEHAPGVISGAATLRDLITRHLSGITHRGIAARDTSDLTRLTEDLEDAAGNAVKSGDTGPLRDIATKIERQLRIINPGPGEHPYYSQALDFATAHLPAAADKVTGPAVQPAGEVASSQPPAKVIAGSVTG